MISKELLAWILQKYGGQASRDYLSARFTAATPAVAGKLAAQGLTVAENSPRTVIRAAMFLLWRSVIPSGTISDLIRDALDDKTVPKVIEELDVASDLNKLVGLTGQVMLDIVF